jgi:hypothetical protein
MTNSIKETYALRRIYSHPSSVAARAPAKPAGEVANLMATHRAEKSEIGKRHREERLALEKKLNARRAHEPHISHDSDDSGQRSAVASRHKAEAGAVAARHRTELEVAMARHPPD